MTAGRKPLALANWKMAMTVGDSLAYLETFRSRVGALAGAVSIVICPPATALHAMARELAGSPVELGAQDLCAAEDSSHTGALSPSLLADSGSKWVLVGHREVRRRLGESDRDVNRKIHAALAAGLRPIILLGERGREREHAASSLELRLPVLFAGCLRRQASRAVVVYEPEWTIGAEAPAPPEHIASGCRCIHRWLEETYGTEGDRRIRVIYGGSVAPEHAPGLLASPDVDGLGAGRKGRDPVAFGEIVKAVADAKGVQSAVSEEG